MILLALVTGHCAWESVEHRDYNRYRTNPHLFWKERFPISGDLGSLLNEVFVQKPEERITLKELRDRVETMSTFYLTEEQLANAPPTVKAVWVAYVERGRVQHKDETSFKPLGSNNVQNRTPRITPSAKGLLNRARKIFSFIRPPRVEQAQS